MKYFIIPFLLFTSLCWAEWIPLNTFSASEEAISVLHQTNNTITLEVSIPGFNVERITENGVTFERISISNSQATSFNIGKPEIPAIAKSIGVPDNSHLSYEIIGAETETFTGYTIYPFQEPTTDNEEKTPFTIDKDFYSLDVDYPKTLVSISDLKVWRDITLTNLRVYPFQYNPTKKELTVFKRMKIIINVQGGISEIITVPPRYNRMYKAAILNYDWMNIDVRNEQIHYLAIIYDDFINAAAPLTEWYYKKGIVIDVVASSTAGSTPEAIKNTIIDHYNSYNTDYVLLVGDVGQIPTYTGYGPASDAWYSFITGGTNDLIAELAIGRLSATSSGSVDSIATKILNYDKNPPLNDWLIKSVLVAHWGYGDDKFSKCKREIYNYPYSYFTPVMDTIMGYKSGQTNETVSAAINDGRNVVNYRGHGNTDPSWECWNLDWEYWKPSDIYALENGDKTPVVFNICCYCGIIGQDESLIEAWVRKCPGGAVAALGASSVVYTDVNHIYDKELYKAYCSSKIWNIGWTSNYAAKKILEMFSYAGDNVKRYLWMGDPMTEIWTAVPTILSVDHPSFVPVGPGDFTVTVTDEDGAPVEGALVCAMKDQETWDSDFTNASGLVTLEFCTLSPGVLDVTVTVHDYLPYEGEVSLTPRLTSNSQDALDGNNQDKLVMDSNSILHLVYKSELLSQYGDIWYTRSTDDGVTWEAETYIGCGSEPCIALDSANNPCIIWASSSAKSLLFRRFLNGEWSEMYKIDSQVPGILNFWYYPSLKISGDLASIGVKRGRFNLKDSRAFLYSVNFATMNITDPVNTFQLRWNSPETEDPLEVGNIALFQLRGSKLAYRHNYDQVFYRAGGVTTNITRGYPICIFQEIGTPSIAHYNNNPFVVWPALTEEGPFAYVLRGMYKEEGEWYGIHDLTQGYRYFPVSPYIAGPDACILWADSYLIDPELSDVLFCIKEGWDYPMMITRRTGDYYKYDPHGLYIPSSEQLYLVYLDNKIPPYEIVFRKIDMSEPPAEPSKKPSGYGPSQDIGDAEMLSREGTITLIYSLMHPSPNPFVDNTTIVYSIAKPGNVSLNIYDISGCLVKTLVQEEKDAGIYRVRWNGCDNNNRKVATGIYFPRFTSADFTSVKKVILVR